MTDEVYEAGRTAARRVIMGRGYPDHVAEDAIQDTAIYFLGRTLKRPLTVPLFTFQAVRRARDVYERAYGGTRPKGRRANEVFVGGEVNLVALESGDEGEDND